MRSIRTKITILIIAAVVVSVVSIGLICILSIREEWDRSSDEHMQLISEAERSSLESYFQSIEQSVETVSRFAADELNRPDFDMGEYLELIDGIFRNIASNASGVLTYYYRIAPEISETEQGFWYSRHGTEEFVGAELTDITAYDPQDLSHVGWYTIPRERGYPSWLELYYNENLNVYMISYVAPIYRDGVFLGVIGMDIGLSTLIEHLDDIEVFETGFAFLTDGEGKIVYHPTLETGVSIAEGGEGLLPAEPDGPSSFLRYESHGVYKRGVCSVLSNGMRLYVTAPETAVNAEWVRLIHAIVGAGLLILLCFAIVTTLIANHITHPLSSLTKAAIQLDEGNYDVRLEYAGRDEVGILTNVFRQLVGHLEAHISDLNNKAYVDALTSVRNKGAFSLYIRRLDELIASEGETVPAFAICMFDCNDLKTVNDVYGHEKGDLYLKTACSLICQVFRHSPVFRLGGDEFAAILQENDFNHREELFRQFDQCARDINTAAGCEWERVSVAKGFAVFDPDLDGSVEDVLKRADIQMYQEKRRIKESAAGLPGGSDAQ